MRKQDEVDPASTIPCWYCAGSVKEEKRRKSTFSLKAPGWREADDLVLLKSVSGTCVQRHPESNVMALLVTDCQALAWSLTRCCQTKETRSETVTRDTASHHLYADVAVWHISTHAGCRQQQQVSVRPVTEHSWDGLPPPQGRPPKRFMQLHRQRLLFNEHLTQILKHASRMPLGATTWRRSLKGSLMSCSGDQGQARADMGAGKEKAKRGGPGSNSTSNMCCIQATIWSLANECMCCLTWVKGLPGTLAAPSERALGCWTSTS